MIKIKFNRLLAWSILSFFLPITLFAQEFTSTNFKVLDPVINPGEYSSSASFTLSSVLTQLGIGTSTQSTYNLFGGFLYFPFVTTPSLTATPSSGQVSLSWTAADGVLGWSVGSYSVGEGTISGGPYTYTNVGNTLSTIRSGLSNGTAYYFLVRVLDTLGNVIATSTQISSTPVAGGGGGGGGGGGNSGVRFSGRAYPLSRVSILKDGQIAVTTIAGPDSNFGATLSDLATGNYTFSVRGEDRNNLVSNPFVFPIFITDNVITEVGGIFISPTITTDKVQVKKGDNIVIFGQTANNADVLISINSEPEHFVTRKSDKDGVYLLNFDSSILALGSHTTKSKASTENEISPYSSSVSFKVGSENILSGPVTCQMKADLNNDCRVNLVDFSIAAFWYKKSLSGAFNVIEKSKLNGDNKVDLIDFSIMAFHWTG